MDVLISVVVGLVTCIAAVELYAWLPKASTRLLSLAVRKLPAAEQKRCQEEWSAAIEALPNTLMRICHAGSFVFAARTISLEAATAVTAETFDQVIANNMLLGAKLSKMSGRMESILPYHGKICSSLGTAAEPAKAKLDAAWQLVKESHATATCNHLEITALLNSASRQFGQLAKHRRNPLLTLWCRRLDRTIERDLDRVLELLAHTDGRDGYFTASEQYLGALRDVKAAVGSAEPLNQPPSSS